MAKNIGVFFLDQSFNDFHSKYTTMSGRFWFVQNVVLLFLFNILNRLRFQNLVLVDVYFI